MALLDPRGSHVLLSPTKLSSVDMHSGSRSGPCPVHLDAHQVVQIEHVAGHHLARSNLQLFGSAEWLGRAWPRSAHCTHTFTHPSNTMRPLTEEESKTVFTKLANYIVRGPISCSASTPSLIM